MQPTPQSCKIAHKLFGDLLSKPRVLPQNTVCGQMASFIGVSALATTQVRCIRPQPSAKYMNCADSRGWDVEGEPPIL